MKASAILMSFLFGYPFVAESDDDPGSPEEPPPPRKKVTRKSDAREAPKVELYRSGAREQGAVGRVQR